MSNAGQAALGIVGGIIGFAVGGPAGAAYGLQIGLAVGTVVSPTQLPGTFGPRLQDKRTTTAQLGEPISEVFGTDVVSGTVIWLGDVVEIATTEEVGGKGGPQQENTTYSYTQSIAVGLCRGPMLGLLRIWENGKLVYDIRPQQPGETTGAYTARLSAATDYAEGFTLYLGDETQLPDPTIELKEGVGNVPAFRGLMYIVFPDRLLRDDQGLRHPSYKFEVSAAEVEELLPRILMVTAVPAMEFEPYSLRAFPTTLTGPLVTAFEETYDDAAIPATDVCGKGDALFAVGSISTTQFWARHSFDSGDSWYPVTVLPLFAVAPELPKQIKPNYCDCSASGRVVVSGQLVDAGSTDIPKLAYTDNNGASWGQCNDDDVESDFRFGVIRYIKELNVWLCGGYRGIARSADGAVFESVVSGVTNYDPVQFAYGDGSLAALRASSIVESTDGGDTWTTVYSAGNGQRALAFGNETWVRWDNGVFGVDDPGFSVATSLAGPWSTPLAPSGWDIRDIIYDGSQFVAVGANAASESLIASSPDGITWTLEASGDVDAPITRARQVQP